MTMNPSSSPIIQGSPSQLGYLGELFGNMEHFLKEAVSSAMDEETTRIQEELPLKEPGYAEIADDFIIQWNPKELCFEYRVKGNSGRKAARLEYGPPAKSLIRHEVATAQSNLGNRITKKLDEMIGKNK